MKHFDKGEIFIEINGREMALKASFACLMEIEKKIKKSLLILIKNLETEGLLTQEIVVILQESLKAGGNDLEKEVLEKFITGKGLLSIWPLIVKFLKKALGINEK